ncbi:2-phosphoglycerate kinase [Acrasis kona]|uniref:2-phosphoglycerate kinase n=1 Tax=Acrasis kona TaxID=1008807 RepID=A0AAW2YXB6_9EUKA
MSTTVPFLEVPNEFNKERKQSDSPIRINGQKKLASSKYDFVKVKVSVEKHYYILSRFIVSRILTAVNVHYTDSVKVSLELKKKLVDLNRLDVTQAELEQHLFMILRSYKYGEVPIQRYKLMTRFHQKRVPLMILMFGTGCVGKSTLATQLGERLNIPNVLQTDLVLDLVSSLNTSAPSIPVWFKQHQSKHSYLEQYKKECIFMRDALDGDINKCLEEGKAIIIEGSHIDPNLIVDLIKTRSFRFEGNNKSFRDIYQEDVESEVTSAEPKKGLILAFFLRIQKKEEHELFFEQWLSSRSNVGSIQSLGSNFDEKLISLSNNFKHIQEYLDQQNTDFAAHINVNLHKLDETLDRMHTDVLTNIERAYQEYAF